MRNILRRRSRGAVLATALVAGLLSVAGPATQAQAVTASEPEAVTQAAASCSSSYLAYGSSGTCVRVLQVNLGGLSVNGSYGESTRKRVREFQDDTGLGVDGRVGPQTWAKLGKYGKAVGWRSGVTVYMCEESSTRFQYSAWNNAGKTADWMMDTSVARISGSAMYNNRVEIQGTTTSANHNSGTLFVKLDREDYRSANVRDFSRASLPTCG
ncbi:peptidoglycan-binding domain-containing protein [Kribbella albertanoniae]|uniref:peptidoglycan-binding domain-containing protein n=1 Tax=Kribbella albertanoniae TaxID=1266829 RepID=UPI00192DFF47|nr:peptidoglycan-binding protein [Kribbella albertanoniae]